jgi:hypothetical protein
MDKRQVIEEMASYIARELGWEWGNPLLKDGNDSVPSRKEFKSAAKIAFAIAERHFTQPAPAVSAETRESVKNALKASVALWPDSVDILPGTIERWLEVVDGQTVPYWAIHATIRVLRELCVIRGRPLDYEREKTGNVNENTALPNAQDAPAVTAEDLKPMREALGLFSSAIKGGESWSVHCQEAYDNARKVVAVLETRMEAGREVPSSPRA